MNSRTFAIILALTLALIGWVYLDESVVPGLFAPFRAITAIVFILFIPGFAFQAALLPGQKKITPVERAALSIGLSIAVIPPLALLLQEISWGIRLWPLTVGLSIITFLFSVVALFRWSRLPVDERERNGQVPSMSTWWRAQSSLNKGLTVLFVLVIVIAILVSAASLLYPEPDSRFTDFYMLGPVGAAEGYSLTAVAGQPVILRLGVFNQEDAMVNYMVIARSGDQVIANTSPFPVEAGQIWESALPIVMAVPGEGQRVEILLYREGFLDPYRQLYLWLDVTR